MQFASFDKKDKKNPIEMEFENLAHRLQMNTGKVKGIMLGIDDLGGISAVDEQMVIDFCSQWRERQAGKEYPKYPTDMDFKRWYHKEQDNTKGDLCPFEMCHGDGYIVLEESKEEYGVNTLGKLCRCVTSESTWKSTCSIWNIKPNPFHMSHELSVWKKERNTAPKFYQKASFKNKQFVGEIKEKLSEAFQND